MATSHPIVPDLGTPKDNYGENAVGNLTLTELVKIPLQPDMEYIGLDVNAHCRTGALFQVVYNDDGTEEVKRSTGSEPGKPDPKIADGSFFLSTAGKTGTQELILKFKNFGKANCVRGGLSTREFTPA